MDDEIRAQINASHRFDSFADQRSENAVKWYVVVRTTNLRFRLFSGILTVMTTCMRCLRCSTVQRSASLYWYVLLTCIALLARDPCVIAGLVADS